MQILNILLICALAGVCICAPLAERTETDPELTAGYYEGDIVLDEDRNRNGLKNTIYRWPDRTVFYKFGDVFDDAHRNHIFTGMRIIEDVSCIRFQEANAEQTYYINITGNPDGCYSSVGWQNKVRTYNLKVGNLDEGCFRLATIVHEMLHTLGFYHMQSSANRDSYVRIAYENISEDKEHNFAKYNDTVVDDFDEGYDYGSVLHYSAYAFSKNGEMTIVPLLEAEASGIMGQRRSMSDSDIRRLNIMYRCPLEM